MKLVFYSGGDEDSNYHLDRMFIDMIGKKDPVITFIPSSSYFSDVEFRSFVKQYSRFKISRFIHFPLDVYFDRIILKEVFKSDAIHLGGGNTFYFLKSLKEAKLLKEIKNYVVKGGVLTGLSAGAILMTENIEMAGYPEFDRDDNIVGIKDLSSLNLVDFTFFPHFKNSSRYDTALRKYSRKNKKIVYACPDGAGISIFNRETRFIGKTFGFLDGRKFIIN